MLTSFGTFWAGEGLGVRWPGSDLAIIVLVAIYALVTWALVALLRRSPRPVEPPTSPCLKRPRGLAAPLLVRLLKGFGAFSGTSLWATRLNCWSVCSSRLPSSLSLQRLRHSNALAVVAFPAAVVVMLGGSVYLARRSKH